VEVESLHTSKRLTLRGLVEVAAHDQRRGVGCAASTYSRRRIVEHNSD